MARKKKPTPAQDKLGAVGIDAICADVAECVPLRHIATNHGVSFATLAAYLSRPENTEQYARAREAQADKMAEDILQIADDGANDTYKDDKGNVMTDHDVVARSRLRVDARKWLASKMAPKKYGDKVAIGGADDLPPVDMTVGLRPQLTKAEWMAAHGVGTAIRTTK